MISHVELQVGDRKASGELTPFTFVVGSGKSLFINYLYKIISNIGNKIPKIYFNKFIITLTIKDKKFSLQRSGDVYRQVLEGDGTRIVFEYGSARGVKISRISEPFELTIKNADVLMPLVEVAEHVSILADEDIESINKTVGEFRKTFGLRALLLGPYINPRASHDVSGNASRLRPDGGNLVGVLSALALKDPDAYDKLRTVFRKRGIKLAVGLSKRGVLAGFAYMSGVKVPISKLPCSLKTALTIATAIATRPDLLLVDNFDYCFNEGFADVLNAYVEEQISRGQIIAEIHKHEVADAFRTQYKSVLSISL